MTLYDTPGKEKSPPNFDGTGVLGHQGFIKVPACRQSRFILCVFVSSCPSVLVSLEACVTEEDSHAGQENGEDCCCMGAMLNAIGRGLHDPERSTHTTSQSYRTLQPATRDTAATIGGAMRASARALRSSPWMRGKRATQRGDSWHEAIAMRAE